MNIKPSEQHEGTYEVDYSVDHKLGKATVSEETAQLLELAKKAGASERVAEMRGLLELSW